MNKTREMPHFPIKLIHDPEEASKHIDSFGIVPFLCCQRENKSNG